MTAKILFSSIVLSFFYPCNAAVFVKKSLAGKRKTVEQQVFQLEASNQKHLKQDLKPCPEGNRDLDDQVMALVAKLSIFIPLEDEQIVDNYQEPLAPRSKSPEVRYFSGKN